jgi:protein SCO1/2
MRFDQILSVTTLLACLSAPAALAQSNTQTAAASQYFTDVLLVDQNGQQVRFYTDLLKGRVVVIETFFGTCTGSCPRMAGILEGLQSKLGNQLGRDVSLLSFSVDPENDTPAKLKIYADQFHARPGWRFLTGKKENVDFALSKLGPKLARREDHSTVLIVWNDKTGVATKVPLTPTTTVESVHAAVESVLNDRE